MFRKSLGVLGLVAVVVSVGVLAQSDARWVVLRSEHLLVAMRADLPVEFYLEGDTLDESLSAFNNQLRALEAQFARVESMLQADYNAEELGRVPVLMYPNLEAYQIAANCLICAAHVGAPVDRPVSDDEALLAFGAHLNLESDADTVFHEFVHIVDFSSVYAGAQPMWYEGMASYIGNTLVGERGRVLMDVLPQYLKLYQQSHGLGLREYLTRPGYGRWTYNLGTHLINVLVQRGGWDRYMQFYRALRSPDLVDYDQIFQEFYGLTLGQIETLWQEQINTTVVTENGQAAYRFKIDQIVVRWIYLRPLLNDPERLSQAYANLWGENGFNVAESEFMRGYLNQFSNMRPTPQDAPVLLDNAQQLRGYAANFFEDETRARARHRPGSPEPNLPGLAHLVRAHLL